VGTSSIIAILAAVTAGLAGVIGLLVVVIAFARSVRAGMRDAELTHRVRLRQCLGCGYRLTGNTSGICPECGSPVTARWQDRISRNPAILGGKPCITGTRIPVVMILGYLAARRSHADILADYPDLIEADIDAALWYARDLVELEVPVDATR
jgi:uncharacterized protein (DUF433 family)